jgi:hypothetical protein
MVFRLEERKGWGGLAEGGNRKGNGLGGQNTSK